MHCFAIATQHVYELACKVISTASILICGLFVCNHNTYHIICRTSYHETQDVVVSQSLDTPRIKINIYAKFGSEEGRYH